MFQNECDEYGLNPEGVTFDGKTAAWEIVVDSKFDLYHYKDTYCRYGHKLANDELDLGQGDKVVEQRLLGYVSVEKLKEICQQSPMRVLNRKTYKWKEPLKPEYLS